MEAVIVGLTPYTSYTCTLHAVTVSDGPDSIPVTVTTAERGMFIMEYTHTYLHALDLSYSSNSTSA